MPTLEVDKKYNRPQEIVMFTTPQRNIRGRQTASLISSTRGGAAVDHATYRVPGTLQVGHPKLNLLGLGTWPSRRGAVYTGAYPGFSEGGGGAERGGGVPRSAKEANKPNKRATGLKPRTCAHQGSMFRP